MKRNQNLCIIILLLLSQFASAQIQNEPKQVRFNKDTGVQKARDTLPVLVNDTISKKVYSPRTAAIRSAILPGLGQIYNKKYWKVPIVYGALGTSAAVFFYNLRTYKRVSFAYKVLIIKDTSQYSKVYRNLQPLVKANAAGSLRNYRNIERKNIDYSFLVFLLLWGLNVVDAVVDANLKGFDVSNDLSLKIKPGFSPATRTTSLSLAFDMHKGKQKMLTLP